MHRRHMLQVALGTACSSPLMSVNAQLEKSFDELFLEAKRDPLQFELARSEKEVFDLFGSKATAPRVPKSKRKVAQKAVDLIVFFEVSGKENYERKLTRPIWPRGESGVTVAIGYDLGAVRISWLHEDWDGLIDASMVTALEPACQKTGAAAQVLTRELQRVEIPWPIAMRQFQESLLPLYIGQTLMALPLASSLSDTSLGALVSLIYNRGDNFTSDADKRKEMVAIKDALLAGEQEKIPELVRKMKRHWKYEEFPGLHKRRDLEAALFEEGLKKP